MKSTLLFLFFSFSTWAETSTQPPFWRHKEKAFRRVTAAREILVSVRTEEVLDQKKRRLIMLGGGLTRASLQKSFEIARDYPKLKEVSSHFKEVRYEKTKKELYVHGEAFKYHARMTMMLQEHAPKNGHGSIEWRVVNGSFLGMQGRVTFEEYEGKTLMGFEAYYEAQKLPLPEFFIEFALEIVVHRVAMVMRSYIEEKSVEKRTAP